MKSSIVVFLVLVSCVLFGQPEPCGPNPSMTSFCDQACVICDIDGFSGVNDLTATGQGFPEFCTTQYNNMQYIAFIAGSENLTVRVDVGTCIGGVNSLEVGFFESSDCENFTAISFCDTDINGGESTTFVSNQTLVIGQHYYLVIDGSNGANCTWTFNVLEGSTSVNDLTSSGIIEQVEETCPGFPTLFSTSAEPGAANFDWTVNGTSVPGTQTQNEITFDQDGVYDVCVTASNVCNVAPPSCTTIIVRTPETLNIDERLCEGECINYNNTDFCSTGTFQEIVILPNGCDSIINIEILVLPQASESVDLWICNDEFYYIGTTPYNLSGSYIDTILTADDCDSIVFLELRAIECEIIGTPEQIPVICNGTATGTLIFSVDQGEPPLTFTYTNILDGSITGTGMTDLLINNQIPGIPAGTYQIYISDDFQNDVVILQEVTEPPVMEIQMNPSDYDGYNVSCFSDLGLPGADGTLMADMLGGVPPYYYNWSDGQSAAQATNLMATTYDVTVTDEVGCSIEASYTLTSAPEIMPSPVFTDPNCDGFETGEVSIDVIAGGTAPFLYGINDSLVFGVDTLWTDLSEGIYQIFIQDANGCITWVESEIFAPQIPVISFLGDTTIFLGDSIRLSPNINDITIKEITWDNSQSLSCNDCQNPFARPVNDTNYTLSVTSEDDCSSTNSLNVFVEKRRRVYFPQMFSPNGDFVNDNFFIGGGPEVDEILSFNIYDRWGGLLFQEENIPVNEPDRGWDGKVDNERINSGLYLWSAEIRYIDDEVFNYTGSITLIR